MVAPLTALLLSLVAKASACPRPTSSALPSSRFVWRWLWRGIRQLTTPTPQGESFTKHVGIFVRGKAL